jgi:sec-independent protein translocase protein TatC
MDDPVKSARSALTRAELPGMSLIEHLEELRKRVIHSAVYLVIGFAVAYAFHERLYGFIQAPLDQLHIPLNFTHPTDGLTLYQCVGDRFSATNNQRLREEGSAVSC